MSQSITIEQIATIASVSPATVSRVLNNRPNVRQKVRERVLQVIQEQNYTPHAAARSLASNHTHIIGLLIPRSAVIIFTDPFFPRVIQGITETCNALGYYLMLSMMNSTVDQTMSNDVLRSHLFDGIVMFPSDVDDTLLHTLHKNRIPSVLVGSYPSLQHSHSVDIENRNGSREAVKHLLALGHQRIGTITGPQHTMVAIERCNGYRQALRAAHIDVSDELIVAGDFTEESGYVGMQRLMQLDPRPSAVFIASDAMAIGALRAIREAGLHVPSDIALVSFDDLPMASYISPQLTTVQQPVFELGATAARMLIDVIENREPPSSRVLLPTSLVVRQSCGETSMSLAG